ncbi:MAG: TOBE domain-containing protein, partial [Pseudomonadota bacterium]
EVMQIGTPEEIYEEPQSLFVASFIGSPPINKLTGRVENGAFRNAAGEFAAPPRFAGEAVMAFRADRATLADPGAGHMAGTVFAVEYTGSGLLVVVSVGDTLVTVFGDLMRRPQIDDTVGIALAADGSGTYFFNAASGKRIPAGPGHFQ